MGKGDKIGAILALRFPIDSVAAQAIGIAIVRHVFKTIAAGAVDPQTLVERREKWNSAIRGAVGLGTQMIENGSPEAGFGWVEKANGSVPVDAVRDDLARSRVPERLL